MEEAKYYDIVTKKEISKDELKQEIPYIVLTNKWKIRVITFKQDGNTEEKFLTLKEEEIARREILRQRLIQLGYKVNDILKSENFIVDGIQINMPNYVAQLQDSKGRKGQALYDCESLNGLIQNTDNGKVINIEGKSLSFNGKSLIEIIGVQNDINSTSIILNINQWGAFKGTYNLKNPEDIKRLIEDQKTMPRNKQEAMQMKQESTQSTI